MTKVLLVEDDNNLREIYEARLAAEGYEISTAKDGEDALAVAKQVKPDLIISDVMMPRISGFEMLDILRNTEGLKHTRIIMLTALGQAEDKTRADSLGADRYLVKSQVTLEDIVKAAHELLNPDTATEEETPPAVVASPEANNFSPTAPPDIAAVAHQSQADAAQATPPAPTLGSLESNDSPVVAPPQDSTQPVPAPAPPVTPTDAAPEQVIAPAPPPAPEIAAPTPQPITPAPAPPADDSGVPLIQMPPQPDEINAATVATSDTALTTSQENTAVTEQIEDFVNTQLPNTTPQAQPANTGIDPVIPTPQNMPADTTAATDTAAASIQPTPPVAPVDDIVANDQALQDAVNGLAASPDDSAQSPNTQPSNGGTKVIQPISDPSAETNQLETLLAQEEMQANLEAGVTGTPIIGDVTDPAASQTPAQAQQPAEAPQIPVQPAPGGVFIPNTNGDADENAL